MTHDPTLPPGYRGVLVTDTAQAQRWEAAFTRLNIEVVVVETEGEEAAQGAFKVAVAERHERRAQALVTSVLQGRAQLPGVPVLSSTGFRALACIAVLLAIALVAILLLRGN